MASAVVELHQPHDSSIASKSSRLHDAVELVPVDNPCGEKSKETAQKCNHFSIREYVSEVRKRNPEHCYPFTLTESTDPLNELPPMVIPNFRWWRCNSCVPEATHNLPKESRRESNGEAQDDVNTNASIILVGQSSKVDNAASVRNTETCTSIDSNDNKNYPVSADLKGKGKAHVTHEVPISSGCENGFLKVSLNQEIPRQTSAQLKADPSDDNEVERRSSCNQNRTTKTLHKDYRVGRDEVGPSLGHETYGVDCVAKTYQEEPQTCLPHQPADSATNTVASIVKLPDLNDCNGEPLREVNNEATVAGKINNQFFEDDDDYLGLERRKKPKVRLLSELLGLKVAQNPAKRKKKIVSSANSKEEYIKQKRVGSQDDGTKKIVGTSEIFKSEPGSVSDDISTDKISKANNSTDQIEKRNKKIKVDHANSSSLLQQKIKSKSSRKKKISSEELPQNLDFLTQIREKNSVLTKMRGRVPQAKKEPTSLITSKDQMPKECQSTQKDGDADQNAAENVRKASENGQYFLSSCRNKETDQLSVPRKDGPGPSSPQAEQTPIAGNSSPKDNEIRHIGETSVTLGPTVACAALLGNQSDAVKTICPTENSGSMIIETAEADRCSRLAQRMPMQVSNTTINQKDLTNEVRGRIQDIDINSIPTDDKTNELGSGDDIPMDIVELMAKNQYERHLDDPKDKHVICEPPELPATHVRPNVTYGVYEKELQKSPQSHYLNTKKPASTNPRTPMFSENFDLYTYYNNNHLGVRDLPSGNMVSARFRVPSQAQERIPPFSVRGLTPNNWNGNLNPAIAQRYPSSFLQPLDSYQKHRAVAPPPRPSGLANRMPSGITNPHMNNKGRIHHQSSGSFLNFNPTSTSSNLEKQQNLNFSSVYSSGNPASSGRSIDVSEAIPAMDLLSLMQNTAKLQNTELSLGPQKAVGPTISRYPFPNSNSRITAAQDISCHPCYPTTLPTARPFPSMYQNGSGNIGRKSAVFMEHIPLTLQGQRNLESSHFTRPSGEHLPPRRPMAPPNGKRKLVASKSKPAYIHNLFQTMKKSSNLRCGAVGSNEKTVAHPPDKVICRLNQNPSEFNDLNLVAQYMIGPENLKPRKKVRHRGPRPSGNSKRQRFKVNEAIPCMTIAKS